MLQFVRPRFTRRLIGPRIFILIGVIGFFAGGCQSNRYREFDKIRGGMDKSQVLDIVGGPTKTQRWHGRDRWSYSFFGTPEGDLIREVHFENGQSTYVGPGIRPTISADEQDRINEASNRAAEINEHEQRSAVETGIQIQRFESVDGKGVSTP